MFKLIIAVGLSFTCASIADSNHHKLRKHIRQFSDKQYSNTYQRAHGVSLRNALNNCREAGYLNCQEVDSYELPAPPTCPTCIFIQVIVRGERHGSFRRRIFSDKQYSNTWERAQRISLGNAKSKCYESGYSVCTHLESVQISSPTSCPDCIFVEVFVEGLFKPKH